MKLVGLHGKLAGSYGSSHACSTHSLPPALAPRFKVRQHWWMLTALSFERWLLLHSEFAELDRMIARASDDPIFWF
jgi:hypothetical protein